MQIDLSPDSLIRAIANLKSPFPFDSPDTGIAVVRAALTEQACGQLCDELVQGGFKFRGDYGNVRQEFDAFSLQLPCPDYPAVHRLSGELGRHVRSCGATKHWRPNDVAVHRYMPEHLGIAAHRDFLRDVYLVAVFSLSGQAELRWHYSNQGPARKRWLLNAGDLVLLRAPGFRKQFRKVAVDPSLDRPIHSIGSPIGGQPRISLAYRMNTDYL